MPVCWIYCFSGIISSGGIDYAKVTVRKDKNFTVISNDIFKDTRLSFKAKGLLTTMLSCPENWNYTIEGLSKLSTDGKASIRSALNELEEYGYLERKQLRNEKGAFTDTEYIVYEQPMSDFRKTDKPTSDKRTQLNNNILNTYELNNNYAFSLKEKGTLCFSDEKAVGQSNVKYRIEDVPYLVGQYAEPNTPGSRIIELRNIIQYFISRYEEESDIRHIDVSDSAIKSIVDAYFYPTGKVVDCEAEDYIWMIDDYFATDYKMNGRRVSKSLQHFFSGKIRENIYMKRI